MPEDLKSKARRAYEEGWNEGNVAVYDELFAPGFVHHSPRLPAVSTREQYKQYCLDTRADWSGVHLVIEDMFAGEDQVAARGTWSATWTAGMQLGVPATGKRGTMQWISIFRFADGKIVELWNNFDFLSMLEQLGVIAVPDDSKR